MTFVELTQAYPCLFTNIASVLIFVVGGRFILQKRHWVAMLLCGALNAPAFLFLILLEDEYWMPVRVGGGILGVEDILCSFMVAAMSWFAVALLFGHRIAIPERLKIVWPRYRLIAGVSVLIFLLSYLVGLTGMTSLVLTCILVAGLLILMKRELWPVAMGGVVGFVVIYLAIVRIYFFIWPDFVLQWNAQAFWGQLVGGIPLGVLVWAAIFGAYWPLFMMHVLDIRYERASTPTMS